MAPRIPVARATLDYLPYVCDFDPENSRRLVIGGGGGANRSGVANKITVIETAGDSELQVTGEIDLSRDEDSVNTLVVGQKKAAGKASPTLVYAGINSSPDDLIKGKNEHFRVFSVSPAPSKGTRSEKEGNGHSLRLAETSRTALFEHQQGDKEAYQRLMRVSPPFPTSKKQLGAVATGFAKQAQIALFEVGTTTNPKLYGVLEISKEAVDLDVIQTGENSFQVAFCDNTDLFTIDIKDSEIDGPHAAFNLSDVATGRYPQFKAVRYLAPGFIMGLANLPNNGGSILSAIRLPTKEGEEGRLAASAKLPSHFKKSTALAVRNVNPPATPGGPLDNTQFIIAVTSLEALSIWTLTHKQLGQIGILVDLLTISNLKNVHPLNITSLAMSGFVPADATQPGSKPSISLASVSMNNTVAIHSIPLKQISGKPAATDNKDAPPTAQYAIDLYAYRPGIWRLFYVIAFMITFVFLATRLAVSTDLFLNTIQYLPGSPPPREQPVVAANPDIKIGNEPTPEVLTGSEFISNLLNVPGTGSGGLYFLHEGDVPESAEEAKPRIQAAVHDADVHGPAKSWEELNSKQQALWKQRLADAGHWTEQMGEKVFKGVVFSEIAGAVGDAVRGAI